MGISIILDLVILININRNNTNIAKVNNEVNRIGIYQATFPVTNSGATRTMTIKLKENNICIYEDINSTMTGQGETEATWNCTNNHLTITKDDKEIVSGDFLESGILLINNRRLTKIN